MGVACTVETGRLHYDGSQQGILIGCVLARTSSSSRGILTRGMGMDGQDGASLQQRW